MGTVVFKNDDFTMIEGRGNLVISAPHAEHHVRNGEHKEWDKHTKELAQAIHEGYRLSRNIYK